LIAERLRPPARESAITVRLSTEERQKLERYAHDHDLRFAQAIRRWIREELPVETTETEERHPTSLDAAH